MGHCTEMLARINFRRPQVLIRPAAVTLMDGYAYITELLKTYVFTEDTEETRRVRGFKGYD